MLVDERTEKLAIVVPNLTEVAPVKLVPVMVTDVPPDVDPLAGNNEVTVGGGGAVKVKWSAVLVALVPTGVVTVTSTTPAAWAGLTAVICVDELIPKDAAPIVPNLTEVAPVKLVPVIVTDVPPIVDPPDGDTAVTVGGAGAE